jgi:hypothetical protein
MRFRYAKNMSDAEALAIAKALSENVKSYDQVVEVSALGVLNCKALTRIQLLSCLPLGSGLTSVAFGLFHPLEQVRDATVDLLNQLRNYSVSVEIFTTSAPNLTEVCSKKVGVLFLQSLNHFQRYAYVRQAQAKERRIVAAADLPFDQHRSTTPAHGSDSAYGPAPTGNYFRAHANSSASQASDRSNNAF